MAEKYRPFATKLREDLYRNLKLLAAAKDRPVQMLLEEAVIQYLEVHDFSEKPSVVRENGVQYSVSFKVPDSMRRRSKK